MVTSGASSGLVLISCMMFSPGSTVFVEDPSYFIALNMLKSDFDMNVVPGVYYSITDKSIPRSPLSSSN